VLLLLLKIQVFRDVTLVLCVGTHVLKYHSASSSGSNSPRNDNQTFMMKVLWSFETLGTTHQITQCHITKNWNLQIHTALYNVIVKKHDKG